MELEKIYAEIVNFSSTTHGSTDYYKTKIFVVSEDRKAFAPEEYLKKKFEKFDVKELLAKGFVHDSLEFVSNNNFDKWYEHQFGRKLKGSLSKDISFIYLPNNKNIFDAIEKIDQAYALLQVEQILINNKKMPVQLGEWYAKSIFGLKQVKSTSQRGFDFYLDGKRVEVKVHWGNFTSPKGVKIRKSLVDLSQYCVVVYIAKNFMIRDICFLDSEFIMRKFAGKGHTVFLKDAEIGSYFFTKSDKHVDKVINKVALMKYSSPTVAMKLTEYFS